jgi:hypothetical protein
VLGRVVVDLDELEDQLTDPGQQEQTQGDDRERVGGEKTRPRMREPRVL